MCCFVAADNYFYPAWAYVWPTVVLRLPYSLLLSILWSAVVYYPVGLAPEASRYVLTVLQPVNESTEYWHLNSWFGCMLRIADESAVKVNFSTGKLA